MKIKTNHNRDYHSKTRPMKAKISILFGFLIFLNCCKTSTNNSNIHYSESQPTFFNLHNGDWLTNAWIRKPENLLAIHETFKKYGYMNLISSDLLFNKPFIANGIFINRKPCDLLDSLELTYNQYDIKEDYYRTFWQRRRIEKNDSVAYLIIKDVNFAIKNKMGAGILTLNTNKNLVNDTLYKLLQIEFRHNSLTSQIALKDFETLKELGFHHSAYNLLFEYYKYYDLSWNRDSLKKTLKQSNELTEAWFQDDTK